ncbi:hypothetical protein BDV59DRAFT_184241 [Aspergillus ambiguus]|uniref:uncharacterized protein n=1 Tax=Aspergillus ambiguus TaxID=176160 RepID=UPI003CCD63A7
MAAVPPDILAPEPAAAFAVRATERRQRRGGAGGRHPDAGGRRWGRRLGGVELFGDVGDGAFEGHAARAGVDSDDVRLGADHVDHERVVVGQALLHLQQPARHLGEAALVRDVVAQEARVGPAIVQPGNTPEAFLSGRVPDLQADDRVRGAVEDALGDEGCADGGRGAGGVEGIFDVALHERGFPDALRA